MFSPLAKPIHRSKTTCTVAVQALLGALASIACQHEAAGPAQLADPSSVSGGSTAASLSAPSSGGTTSVSSSFVLNGGTSADASRGGSTVLYGGNAGATARLEPQGGRAAGSSTTAIGGSLNHGGSTPRSNPAGAGSSTIPSTRAAGGASVTVGGNGGTRATSVSGSSSGGATHTSVASAGSGARGGASSALPAVTVYLAGDSIVSAYTDTSATNDQAGWGQMLPPLFSSKVTFVNRAAGGRTAYWFYLEGALEKILSAMKPGDYLFIEFGTNDQNTTATFEVNGTTYPRLAEPAAFKAQLKQYYLDPVRAKGATPVLITPPPRNSAYCNGGNGLGTYATAMLELGAAENVVVVDNNAKTYAYVKAMCPKPATAETETFFCGKSDGSIDGTHFQENGARKMAGFIAEGVRASGLVLASYVL